MRIAFLSRIQRKFNHATLKEEPIGGTQSALLHISKYLAQYGHEVHIFSSIGKQESEGVFFHPVPQLARFARQNPLDFFISVADEMALKLRIPAKYTLAWLQNDYPHLWDEMPDMRSEFSNIFANYCDRVIVTSDWQAKKLGDIFQLPKEHFSLMPNGIEPEYYPPKQSSTHPPRLLYSSVPNRGLDLLLDMFPEIKNQVPELELHIYSSFKIWGMSPEKDQIAAGKIYKKSRSMDGVFLHEPVSPFL